MTRHPSSETDSTALAALTAHEAETTDAHNLAALLAAKANVADVPTVADLDSALAALAATVSTDAEREAAVATLTAALATKQDAATAATDADVAAAIAAALTPEPWHVIGDPGEPAFNTGWTALLPDVYHRPGFRKLPDGQVVLRGIVQAPGSLPDTPSRRIFTLPEGYRPAKQGVQPMVLSTGAVTVHRIFTQADGELVFQGAAGAWGSLDGLRFALD